MVSIIIPTYNSEKYLLRCLDGIKQQNYPKEGIEIIVIDNGSSDGTLELVKKYTDKVFVDRKANVSGLRNFGAKQAIGDVLFFLDSDCIPGSDWIENALRIMKEKEVSVVGCWYQISPSPTWVEKAWDLQMSWRRGEGRYVRWIPSGDLIIKKDVFDSINGFNVELKTGEDTDICNRLIINGNRIFASSDIAVVHLGEAQTLRQFYLKQKWHGAGAIQRFVREFPGFIVDKSFIFSFLLMVAFGGMIRSVLVQDIRGLIYFVALLLLIPVTMSIKTILRVKDCRYFFALLFLYLTYGLARTVAFLNLKLWIEEILDKNTVRK